MSYCWGSNVLWIHKILWKSLKQFFRKQKFLIFLLMWTTLHFEGRSKKKEETGNICMGTPDIEFEQDWSVGLDHGCARVAHCVTARWRNLSHYCRPLRQYDVRITCSDNREALTAAQTAHNLQKQAFIVHHWTSREASLRHSSGWGLKRFPSVAWFADPWFRRYVTWQTEN